MWDSGLKSGLALHTNARSAEIQSKTSPRRHQHKNSSLKLKLESELELELGLKPIPKWPSRPPVRAIVVNHTLKYLFVFLLVQKLAKSPQSRLKNRLGVGSRTPALLCEWILISFLWYFNLFKRKSKPKRDVLSISFLFLSARGCTFNKLDYLWFST